MGLFDLFKGRKPTIDKPKVLVEEKAFADDPARIGVGVTNIRLSTYFDNASLTQKRLLAKYDEMDTAEPLFAAALNIWASDVSSGFYFSSTNPELREIGEEYFYKILKIDTNLNTIVRDKLKYGSTFLENKIVGGRFVVKHRTDIKSIVELESDDGETFYIDAEDTDSLYGSKAVVKSKYAFVSFYYNRRNSLSKVQGTLTYPIGRPNSILFDQGKIDSKLEFRVVEGRSLFLPLLTLADLYRTMTTSMSANRIARSKVFNLVGIDTSRMTDKAAAEYKNDVKNVIERTETLDLFSDLYGGEFSPTPEYSSIYYTTRDGVGAITIDRVGTEGADVSSISDLDNIENRLVAGLGVPRRLLLPFLRGGSLGDNSLEIEDKHYKTRVDVVKTETVADLERAFEEYLDLLEFSVDERNYVITLAPLSQADSQEYQAVLQSALMNANSFLELMERYGKADPNKVWSYTFDQILGIDESFFEKEEEIPERVGHVRFGQIESPHGDVGGSHIGTTRFGSLVSSVDVDHDCDECDIEYPEGFYPEDSDFIAFTDVYGDEAYPLLESIVFGGDVDEPLYDDDYRVLNESTVNELLELQREFEKQPTVERSKKHTGRYVGVNDNGDLIFSVKSSKGDKTYDVIVRFRSIYQNVMDESLLSEPNVLLKLLLSDDDVHLWCSCPAWLYWGAHYAATVGDYNAGRPELRRPRVRPDIKLNNVLCRHTYFVLSRILRTNWSTITRDLRNYFRSRSGD